MKIRKSMLAALCVASLAGAALPIQSSAAVDVFFNVAPPPARVEVVPGPRHGFMWVPGYWDLRGHRHVWIGGHWERETEGQRKRSAMNRS